MKINEKTMKINEKTMKINEKSMKIYEKSMENRYKKQMRGQQARPTPEATPAHGHNPPFSNRFQTVFKPFSTHALISIFPNPFCMSGSQ